MLQASLQQTVYCVLLLSLYVMPVLAHDREKDANTSPARVLGELSFATSTDSKAAQQAFERGMLLLHLFEYPFAAKEFQQAREIDPNFVMAYWGEAMTHNHPLWDQQDREQALIILQQLGKTPAARQATTTVDKERDWLAALDVLYLGKPGADRKTARDLAYLQHLQAMAQRYPEDHEVQLLHALAIFGISAGVRDSAAYMQAAAIAQQVFYANRQHPGAAHYLIHGVDDPLHAPLGLEAARALAEMAPDAGHSLHMTSHIFIAVGLWDDVVAANINAARVSNAMAAEQGRPARHYGHYNYWLLYALLQQGELASARELLLRARADVERVPDAAPQRQELDPDNSALGSLVQMWARYLIESRRIEIRGGEIRGSENLGSENLGSEAWGNDDDIMAWQFLDLQAFDPQLNIAYARGMLADSAAAAGTQLALFEQLHGQLTEELTAQQRQAPADQLYLQRLAVMAEQLRSAHAHASGDISSALQHAREASRLEGLMPHSFGPPFVDWPAAQWLGELLLEQGMADAATEAFRLQLERSRGKRLAKQGLAAAAGQGSPAQQD